MPVTITIRNVPDDVRNRLAARAAGSGRSLQEYLKAYFVEGPKSVPIEYRFR